MSIPIRPHHKQNVLGEFLSRNFDMEGTAPRTEVRAAYRHFLKEIKGHSRTPGAQAIDDSLKEEFEVISTKVSGEHVYRGIQWKAEPEDFLSDATDRTAFLKVQV